MIELTRAYPFNFKITTIGGGSGQFVTIDGLKKHNNPNSITAITPHTDRGGSSGDLQRMLEKVGIGLLPPGDPRQCLLAFMDERKQQSEAAYFRFRFPQGTELAGHSAVNMELAALEIMYGSQEEAIRAFQAKHNIPGRIVPVSPKPNELVATLVNGEKLFGEDVIDLRYANKLKGRKHWTNPIDYISLSRDSVTSLSAIEAINESDAVVLTAGDLYTSVGADLINPGMAEQINASKAQVIVVINLFTKPGETDYGKNGHFDVSDFLRVHISHLRKPRIDTVIINNAPISEAAKRTYAKKDQHLVVFDEEKSKALLPHARFVEAPIGELDHRSNIVRHNSDELASTILAQIAK